MTDWTTVFTGPLADRLGRALLAFLWQGTLAAGGLASLNMILRGRDARIRYAASCATLFLMLLLPLATLGGGQGNAAVAPTDRLGPRIPMPKAGFESVSPSEPSRASTQENFGQALARRLTLVEPWLGVAWLAGVALFSLRLLSGWAAMRRLSREAWPVAASVERLCARVARRLRVYRPVRLLESVRVTVPSALGIFRPILLLPASVATGLAPEDLEAVLAHELAHIRRHDYFVNLLQTVAETLLFYHPAVWWVSRQIRLERENCCDDLAVAATGDARLYARALYDLERIRGAAPQFAMAATGGGSLWNRIRRLLPTAETRTDRASRWLAGPLALCAILAMGTVAPFSASALPETALAAQSRPAQSAQSNSIAAGPVPADRPAVANPKAEKASTSSDPVLAASSPARTRSPEPSAASEPAQESKQPKSSQPALASPKPARHLSPEQLIAFRIHGVTPEYVEEIASLGYTRISPDTLLALRIHGVTREFLSGLQDRFGKVPLEMAVRLKIHGVTPEFVRAMAAEGLSTASADEAVSMKIHGVNPEFVRDIHALGLRDASAEELIAFRIHGVTPEFVRELQSLGYTSLTAGDLVAMRIHGVTPEWIRRVNKGKAERLSVQELLERRIRGFGEER